MYIKNRVPNMVPIVGVAGLWRSSGAVHGAQNMHHRNLVL